MGKVIKVLVVDDHAVVRAGITKILETEVDITIVGEAVDGEDAVTKALELKPDVILMDIFMPRLTGLESMLAIKARLPLVQVLILTVSDREEDLFKALRFGAQGYLLKRANINQLPEAIRKTAAGESMLSPDVAAKLVAEFRQQQEHETKLSDREIEVLLAVGEGLTNTEVARRLFISESTVRTHLQRILEKLHLKNRAEAIAYASQRFRNHNPHFE